MSYESKLAQSIQNDYRRDAQIERQYGSGSTFKGTMIKLVVTITSLAIVGNFLMVVAIS